MIFLYNILCIHNVPVGHILFTKPWDRPIKIIKMEAKFPELLDLCSTTSEIAIALFEFPMVGKVL
jgi:hypothetical protein